MNQFMRQRKHLRCGCISSINENQRRKRIAQCEPPEFINRQTIVCIILGETDLVNENSSVLNIFDISAPSVFPFPGLLVEIRAYFDRLRNCLRYLANWRIWGEFSYKWKGLCPIGYEILPIPFLPSLTLIDDAEKPTARSGNFGPLDGPKIGNWQRLLWWFRKKKIPERRFGRCG